MLITGATSAIQRPQGDAGARKFAVAALVIFLAFAGFFATAQRARADTGIPASGASGAMAGLAAQVPPGSTVVPPPTAATSAREAPVVPVQPVPQPMPQDAATGQAATADAAATQPQQANSLGATRTDSSGRDTAAQQNDVSVVGAAANPASTSQTAGSGQPPADGAAADAGQQATTDQTADAAAAAVQPQQSNVVIIIRINSPGDDVISQTNVVSVVAVAANQSWTSQNPAPAQNQAPAGGSRPGTASLPQSSSGGAASPSTSSQPAQSAGAGEPQPGDTVQPQSPRAARALSILAFSADPNADAPAPEHQATSPTSSASRQRAGGVAGRSGASGVSAAAATRASGVPIDSGTPSVQTPRPGANRTGTHSSDGFALGGVRDHVARWLGRAPVAARPQLAADGAGGVNLGLLTLTALLVGTLGWAALNWLPPSRR
jgi:ribonuclease E